MQSLDYQRLLPSGEELDCLVDCHVKHVGDVLAVELHFEDVALETLAVAMLTLKNYVSHKLHLNGYHSRSLALLATPSLGIEREELRGESHLYGKRLVGIKVAYGIVCLDVCGRIGAGALAYGVLVNKLHMLDCLDVAHKRTVFAGGIAHITDMTLEGGIQYALDKTRLARTAHTRDYCHHIERKGHIYAFQIVHSRPLHLYLHIPRTAALGNGNGVLAGEILEGVGGIIDY